MLFGHGATCLENYPLVWVALQWDVKGWGGGGGWLPCDVMGWGAGCHVM